MKERLVQILWIGLSYLVLDMIFASKGYCEPITTALAAVGTFLGSGAGMAAMGGASTLAGLGQGYLSKRSAEKQASKAQELWQQNAFPSPEQVAGARGQLGQSTMATRANALMEAGKYGWGSGSGLLSQRMTDIDKAKIENQAKISMWSKTPGYPMPSQAYGTATPGGWETALGTVGQMGGTLMGYNMMGDFWKKYGGGSAYGYKYRV